MASDIDIEEHNLFENPELRVLFPDITALKQEIYDEDFEVTNIHYDQTTQKCEYQLELDDSQHFDENKRWTGKKKHALQPKTCILKNEIVGSKPKSSKTKDFPMKHNKTKQLSTRRAHGGERRSFRSSNMPSEWSNEITIKFLELLETEKVIWDVKDKQQKHKVHNAWKKISVVLDIPIVELKFKNSL
ncbi:uncharacterized protein LOC111000537 isoform X5 [Pieris rapae]|uniref:uncharacterized protein LOC111000537 isoform X5 n=1 Tax=Pieris rapae TaxID=64459 RepID=UPI001E27F705|nr:uncharacterized protein LOC111000537 isoform X5 [Pieris rapae]